MENENKTLLDKIKDEIILRGGLTNGEISSKFLGIKNEGPATRILVEKIFKERKDFSFDGQKWQAKIFLARWEKAQFGKENLENEPQTFGVFGFYDENKKVIFVGSACNLREKLLELWDGKEDETEAIKKLRESAVSYIVSACPDEKSSQDTEQKLIVKHRPVLN